MPFLQIRRIFLCFVAVKEPLIKSDVQITPPNFSSEKCKNCAGILTDFK